MCQWLCQSAKVSASCTRPRRALLLRTLTRGRPRAGHPFPQAQTGDLPSRKSAWTTEGPAGDPQAQAFRTQLEHVRATPKIPEWERIADQITRHTESAIRGRLTIDEALAALDRDADETLEKRRWLMRTREGRSS